MGSESSEHVGGGDAAPARKPMPRRRKKKMMIVVVVVAVVLIIILWGWGTTGAKDYLQVSKLVDSSSGGSIPSMYLNRTVEVQGVIESWAGGAGDLSFSLVDRTDPAKAISVTLEGTMPAEFANGKTAVVKGELKQTLPLRLMATEITLGCASRY